MSYQIFYSWQSDSPNSTNRTFIEKALENAIKRIRSDATIKVEPVIERDTKGLPGSPNISEAIFDKIDQSQIFVCDVSIINKGSDSRLTPNPNVLIELGYALKVLGPDRVIMVMNTDLGPPELLPFDLKMRRALTYSMPENKSDRASERKILQGKIESAIRLILENHLNKKSVIEEALSSINGSQKNVASKIRNVFEYTVDELSSIAPDFSGEGEKDDKLVEAIGKSTQLVLEHGRIVQALAQVDFYDGALEYYKGFQAILEKYNHPLGVSGYPETDHDFYKFVGHELFTGFISCLVLEKRWGLISDILNEDIFVQNTYWGKADVVSFDYISADTMLLIYRKNRLGLQTPHIRAEMLSERHSQEELATIIPLEQFAEADFFLFLKSEKWYPYSNFKMLRPPQYLFEAKSKNTAEKLLEPLGFATILEFRAQLASRLEKLKQDCGHRWYALHFQGKINPSDIGSK